MFLAIDVSTAQIRTCLVDPSGVVSAEFAQPYLRSSVRTAHAIQTIFERVVGGLRTVVDRYGKSVTIQGIALTGSVSNLVGVTERAVPVTPIIDWQNQRPSREAAFLSQGGYPCAAEDALPKIIWLRKHHASTFKKAARFSEVLDCIAYRATGSWSADISTRSRKYSADESGLPPKALMALTDIKDLDQLLPAPVVQTGGLAGLLREDEARRIGIASLPLFRAGYDTVAQMFALGFVTSREDLVGLSLGSSCGIFARHGNGSGSTVGRWCPFKDLVPGASIFASGHAFGGLAVRQLLEKFSSVDHFEPDFTYYEKLESAAFKIRPESVPAIVLQGNRQLDRDFHQSLSPSLFAFELPVSYRAVLQALAAELTILYMSLVNATGLRPKRIVAGGGLAQSKLLVKVLANMIGTPLFVASRPEYSTSRGAAIAVVLGSGSSFVPEQLEQMVQLEENPIEPDKTQSACRVFFEDYRLERQRMGAILV